MRLVADIAASFGRALEAPAPAMSSSSASARAGAWLISFCTIVALFFGVAFFEQLTTSRLLLVLAVLLMWHLALCPRLSLSREIWLYGAFVAYLFIALLWTPDVELALNTMFPAVDFLVAQILVSSLLAFHDRGAVWRGMLAGFLFASVFHTWVMQFPFGVPADFSYNGVALVYCFGLFLVVIYGCVMHSRALATPLALVMLFHVVATTSIKANLGVAAGAGVAALFYFSVVTRLVRRNLALILLGMAAAAYLVFTNPGVLERLQYAFDRVGVGIQVLQAREDVQGYSGFNERSEWMQLAMDAVRFNPLYGHGVEAFRAKYGVTSHSSAADLLYNVGAIGCGLFYLTFASLGWRLLGRRSARDRAARATILAALVCFVSMTFSGTIFYHPLLGVFLAISVHALRPSGPGRVANRAPVP